MTPVSGPGMNRSALAFRPGRGIELLRSLTTEGRLAVRRLVRQPGFAIPVISTLSLGIGAAVSVFALVHAVLLRPLPYPEPDRLVAIKHAALRGALRMTGVSRGVAAYYRLHNRVFEDIALYAEEFYTLTTVDGGERVRGASVTPSILSVLRPSVFVGRSLAPGAFDPTHFGGRMISHSLWVRRYGADSGITKQMIEIDRRGASANGVLPPGFGFPRPDTELWDAISWPELDRSPRASLRNLDLEAVARLKPGVSLAAAQQDLQRLIATLPEVFPDVSAQALDDLGLRVVVVPLREAIVGDARVALWLLVAASLFLLLIASANVATLTLMRTEGLQRELAVTLALGAGPARIARRFLAESAVLSAAGGILGFGIAAIAVVYRFGFPVDAIPRLTEVRVDAIVVAAAAAVTVLSSALLAVVGLSSGLRARTGGALTFSFTRVTASPREQMVRRGLVCLQVALALTLMIGAALMAESYRRLSRFDLGFDPRGAIAFRLPVPVLSVARNDPREIPRLYHAIARVDAEVLERLRSLPGVHAAEAASLSGFPLLGASREFMSRVAVANRLGEPVDVWPLAFRSFATPGYFAALGIPILEGRTFGYEDTRREGHGIVVSASLAKSLFPGQSAITQRIKLGTDPGSTDYTIVGVVGDIPVQSIRDGRSFVAYLPNVYPPQADTVTGVVHNHVPNDEAYLLRTDLPLSAVLPSIHRAVREIDPKLVAIRPTTLEELVDQDTSQARLTLLLLLVASGSALLLGLIGIYGVLSYAVSQRRTELGVRIALGQRPADLIRMVVRQGLRLALTGIALGLVTAIALTRYLRTWLYEISPSDPAVYAMMAALLAVAAGLASYLPARHAGRISPLQALRQD